MYEEELDYDEGGKEETAIEQSSTPVFDPPPGHPLKPIEVKDDGPVKEPLPWLCRPYFEASKSSSGDAASSAKPEDDFEKLSSLNEDDSFDTVYKSLVSNEFKVYNNHNKLIGKRDKYPNARAEARVLLRLRNSYRKAHSSLKLAQERFRRELEPIMMDMKEKDGVIRYLERKADIEYAKFYKAHMELERLKEKIEKVRDPDNKEEILDKIDECVLKQEELNHLHDKHRELKKMYYDKVNENKMLKEKISKLESELRDKNKVCFFLFFFF